MQYFIKNKPLFLFKCHTKQIYEIMNSTGILALVIALKK